MKRQKGFTLIELLVVIAIIGILSAIVLASLNTARSRAKDATVQGQMASARAQAEIYYGGHSNAYTGVCTAAASDNGLLGLLTASASSTNATVGTSDTAGGSGGSAQTAGQVKCNDAALVWVAQAPLTTAGTYWCVDSTGISKSESAVLSANQSACI